jgi:hypothetical protein
VLREQAARSGCTGTEHRPDLPTRRGIDDRDWARFLDADDARRAAILLDALPPDDL